MKSCANAIRQAENKTRYESSNITGIEMCTYLEVLRCQIYGKNNVSSSNIIESNYFWMALDQSEMESKQQKNQHTFFNAALIEIRIYFFLVQFGFLFIRVVICRARLSCCIYNMSADFYQYVKKIEFCIRNQLME